MNTFVRETLSKVQAIDIVHFSVVTGLWRGITLPDIYSLFYMVVARGFTLHLTNYDHFLLVAFSVFDRYKKL